MWLLLLALPLQGVAAATMASCGMAHGQPGSSVVLQHRADAVSPPAAHAHAGTAVHHRHADVNADADAGPRDDGKTASGAGIPHKCGTCAACCLGAAAPMTSSALAVVELTDSFAPLVTRTLDAFVSEGLERPPRLFLA